MDNKLENYSKAEIIEAVRFMAKYYGTGRNYENQLISIIHDKKRNDAFAEAQKARQTAIDRMNEFIDWKKEMAEKYGNNGMVYFKDLPREELERGANLEKAWVDSENARKKAEKNEEKYYG